MIIILTEKDLNESGKTTDQPLSGHEHFGKIDTNVVLRSRLILFYNKIDQKVIALKNFNGFKGEVFGEDRERYLKIMENLMLINGEESL